jgi:hypothetical protein
MFLFRTLAAWTAWPARWGSTWHGALVRLRLFGRRIGTFAFRVQLNLRRVPKFVGATFRLARFLMGVVSNLLFGRRVASSLIVPLGADSPLALLVTEKLLRPSTVRASEGDEVRLRFAGLVRRHRH